MLFASEFVIQWNRGLNTSTETKNKVEGALLLDVVISKSVTILQLLACKDEALLVRRNTFLVLDLGLHIVNAVTRLYLEGDSLASESLDENLHTSTETKNKVKSTLLLDVVVTKGVTILQLLACEDEALLVRRNTFLVLDLGLHTVNRVDRVSLEGDSLASKSLNEDLHAHGIPTGVRFQTEIASSLIKKKKEK